MPKKNSKFPAQLLVRRDMDGLLYFVSHIDRRESDKKSDVIEVAEYRLVKKRKIALTDQQILAPLYLALPHVSRAILGAARK